MKTKDNINFNLEGHILKVLRVNETIEENDFVRPIIEDGSEGGFCKTYKLDKWQGTAWHKVTQDIPFWVGKSQMDYLKLFFENSPNMDVTPHFEIVRIIQ